MSDLSHPDDDLLSSALDGELTATERADLDARLAADPTLRERHAQLEAARDLLATPVTPLAGPDADRIIAAALAASATAGNVTDLSAAVARRRVWPARLATAAAAVVALAIAVPALRAIDSDDDADTADGGGEAFEGAVADDGDADTAGDMALESSPAETAPSIAGIEPDDAAADDADTAETNAADTDAGDAFAYSPDDLRLFRADEGFDPLADDLGDFDDTGELSQAVSQVWSAYRPPAAATTTTNASPPSDGSTTVERNDVLAAARSLLDPVVVDACSGFADLVIDYFAATGDAVTAADYALARSNGVPAAVGVFRLSDDQAVLLVVDLADCTLEDARLDR